MKLRHTNHRNAQFYNFFKKNNNNIFWANVRVSGEGRQINIKIISRQYKREKEIYEWSVWHTFRRIHKLCLSLSRLSFLFRVITIIFLYLLSTIIVCNIKKNIYSALIPLLLFLILNSLTHSSLVIVSHFP